LIDFVRLHGAGPGRAYSTVRQRWAQDGGAGPQDPTPEERRQIAQLLGVPQRELWR
jgi:hypothetical protein